MNQKTDRKLLFDGLLNMGTFMNTNIYTFTQFFKKSESKASKPKIKSLIKLIRYLAYNFPNYSSEFFMYHLYSRSGLSKNLSSQDLVYIKSSLIDKVKKIEITSIQQNSNITIKNINVNSSTSKHCKTASNTRDSIDYNKFQYKSSGSISENSYHKNNEQMINNIIIPSKINLTNTNNIKNIYVVARDKQIRYKTEYDTSEEESDITIINNRNQSFNTPIKKKAINYYS